jgi:flagella basal body P-ring formation protein FlgA
MSQRARSRLFIALIWALSSNGAFAQQDGAQTSNTHTWGAEDIRTRVAEWMESAGRPVAALESIGPLDPRVRVPACDDLHISGRSAASASLLVECKAPAWRFVLRTSIAPVGGAVFAPASSTPALEPGGARQFSVVVLRSSLPAGSVLNEDALEERFVSSPPPAQALRSLSQAAGLRLTTSVAGGVALTMRNVARMPLVMKGESVTLVASGSGFQIAAPARAEEDGYEGDLISVRNAKTGVVLKGRLERDKTVVVLRM